MTRGAKNLLLIFTATGLIGASVALASPPAHAACGGIETVLIPCADSADPTLESIKLVLRVLIGLVGVTAVGALVFAGILYSSASGDTSQVQKAKTMIQNTVIGLVLFGGMMLIGNWMIPGGMFGGDIAYDGNGTGGGVEVPEGTSTPPGTKPGTGGGSTSPGTTPGTGGGSAKKYTTITIASWNVLYNNGASDIKTGAKKVASGGANLIGFQELNFPSSRTAVKDALINCSGCNYSGYFPGGSSESGWNARSTVSLVWNKDMFSKLDEGSISVSGPDGPANTGSKWITWVKLKDKRTGVAFYFADTHLVAHVANRNPQVIENYKHHIGHLMDFVSGKNAPIFIAGDFNMGYSYDKSHDYSYSPMRNFKKQNIYSNWDLLNISAGSIDYVWSSKRTGVSFVSAKRWSSSYGSDHRPVSLTLKLYEG